MPRHVRATLEVDLDDQGSLDGSLHEDGSRPVPFSGWLGLVGAILDLGGSRETPVDLLGHDPAENAEEGSPR